VTNYWNLKMITRGNLEAEKLIEKLSSICDYGIGFTVNPLQCRLLAEAFERGDLPESLDLKILYDGPSIVISGTKRNVGEVIKRKCLLGLGMTVNDNRFIHSTFAEYFASKYFFQKIKEDLTFVEFLIFSVFCEDNFCFMRCFFNVLLSQPATHGYMEEKFSVMGENNLEQIQNGILKCSTEGNGRIMKLIFSRVDKWKRPDNVEEGTQNLGIGAKILIG
jgi:hypothetical protein